MPDSRRHEEANQLLNSVVVVLVKTTHSGNIGAVARACKTMGITHLRLAEPVAEIDHEARRRSSGAEDVLDSARTYHSLVEAVADCHHVVGASARTRSMSWPISEPRELADQLLGMTATSAGNDGIPERIALVFGQEASGLSNEELQLCNRHVCIPANPDYSSLNLAMAVQVVAYEMRVTALQAAEGVLMRKAPKEKESPDWDVELAQHSEVEGMMAHVEEAMVALGYLDPENPRMLMPRLRRLYMRSRMDKLEVNIIRGMCKAILNQAKSFTSKS